MLEKIKFIFRAYKYKSGHDRVELAYVIKNTQEGDVVIDIGCHKGAYLYWMHKSVGSTGKVIAFEPQPILFNYLQKIKQLFNYTNITIEHAGVSSKKGKLELLIPRGKAATSPGATFNTQKALQEECGRVAVNVITLDEYIGTKTPIRLIKVDVEGHELEVFKGGEQLLRVHKPKLVFECEARHSSQEEVQAVFTYLQQLGYKGFFIQKDNVFPLEQFKLEMHQKNNAPNYWDADDYCNNFIFE